MRGSASYSFSMDAKSLLSLWRLQPFLSILSFLFIFNFSLTEYLKPENRIRNSHTPVPASTIVIILTFFSHISFPLLSGEWGWRCWNILHLILAKRPRSDCWNILKQIPDIESFHPKILLYVSLTDKLFFQITVIPPSHLTKTIIISQYHMISSLRSDFPHYLKNSFYRRFAQILPRSIHAEVYQLRLCGLK